MDRTWYLGPLGKLRGLVCPERGMSDTSTRYGGIHQGLTGARTMDITGHRREYEFEFVYMDKQDFAWLNALDRKSTRLNSSHVKISYAVFCLKKKKKSFKLL